VACVAHYFVFIDESGDLGFEKGSKFLVLAALFVQDCDPLDRIMKNARRNKLKRFLHGATEIKANKSSDYVIRHFLEKLNTIAGCKVVFVVLEKKRVRSRFLKENAHKLYNYVAGKLARSITEDADKLTVRIDRSKGKLLLREEFNAYFRSCLRRNVESSIEHSYSHNFNGLQFADLLAWACFQKFEFGNSEFIDLLKLEKDVRYLWQD